MTPPMSPPPPTPPVGTTPGPELLGTRLRHLLDLLDAGVAAAYADLGPAGFRPRYTPVVRVLAAHGPASIRDLAAAIGVTHSAASQTVAHMVKAGLVTLSPGADARRRIVTTTPEAERLLPVLDAEWAATTTAARALEAELPYPLSRLIDEALTALDRRPMRDRIADAMAAHQERPRPDPLPEGTGTLSAPARTTRP
ncbi:MarR family transcriptional regulator [Embleya hyalina]|uniref:MarR family transcriptional regulator n=1 Tax=Embleya hyalina TaxID=516124 RepID=A0A401YJK8_9ACTN|nr:helix-turn-helix domain-containing protein [Embleya hyalina]GCD94767.1 MarR family transcriptional regulator [Embleya hyalina]